LLVIVPPHIPQAKRQLLQEDGATVLQVDLLTPKHWTPTPSETRWIDQFTKLHLWNLTQFDRILYLDSDMLLTRHLDDIWDEEAVLNPQQTKQEIETNNAHLLPKEYVIVAETDNEGSNSERPTPLRPQSRLNAGFMVLKPDRNLLEYYLSLLNHPDIVFERAFMEMGLLNAAHRWDSPMPWSTFKLPLGRWSNNWPLLRDVGDGSATLHDKFWEEGNQGWIERELVEMWWRVQGRMEGFWQGRE
jgi:alpha-N-acetylglucosamine transferase